MVSGRAKVENPAGIHVRPSGIICTAIRDVACDIELSAKGRSTDLKSVMGLIALGLLHGDEVEVQVAGPDERGVCSRLIEMLEKRYDFPSPKPD